MAKDKTVQPFVAITKDKFTIDTIDDLIANTTLKIGDIVRLNGYYEKGDGADHIRKIEREGDGSGILLGNGLYANIVHNGEVNVNWFGAKGDGKSDDTLAIQNAINFSNNIVFSKGIFLINEPILDKKTVNIRGIGRELTSIKANDGMEFMLFPSKDCYFRDIEFNGNKKAKNVFMCDGDIHGSRRTKILKCGIMNGIKSGLYQKNGWNVNLELCWIQGNGNKLNPEKLSGGIVYEISSKLAGWSNSGNEISSCYITGNSYGIYADKPWSCVANKNVYEWNNYPIFVDSGNSQWLELSPWFENNMNKGSLTGCTIISGRGVEEQNILIKCIRISNWENPEPQERKVICKSTDKDSAINSGISENALSSKGGYWGNDEEVARIATKVIGQTSGNGKGYGNILFYTGVQNPQSGGLPPETNFELQMYINHNGNLLPYITSKNELGSANNRFKAIYVDNIYNTSLNSLDTPYYTRKMQQEGVYDDFITYMDEKVEYDLKQKQQNNSGFMMLSFIEEPKPSKKLLEFAEKYLG